MQQSQHDLPTRRDHFHARWAVIAAVIGAAVGALGGGAFSRQATRDVTDAKLLEMQTLLETERTRADRLEAQLESLKTAPPGGPARAMGSSPSLHTPPSSEPVAPLVTKPAMEPVSTETPYYKFVATAVSKAANSIRVTFLLVATLDNPVRVSFGGCSWYGSDQIYLLDDNGVRWELDYNDGDTARFTGHFSPLELLPNTRLKGEFIFFTKGDSSGTLFTLTARQCAPSSGQLVVPGLKAG